MKMWKKSIKWPIQFWDDELATISPMTKEIIEMYKTLAKRTRTYQIVVRAQDME